MHSAIFYGRATINDGIVVDESYLDYLINDANTGSEYIVSDVKIPGYVKCDDGYFTKADPNNWKIGDIRIKFTYIPASELDEVSIVGLQDGDKITPNGAFTTRIDYPAMTVDEINSELTGDPSSAARGMFLISGILLGVGVIVYFVKGKRNNGGVV